MVTATTRSMSPGKKSEIGRIPQWGVGLTTGGVLVAAASVYLRSLADPASPPPTFLLVDLLTLSGMTCFALGLLGIILGTRNWEEYLKTGLREIVLQPSYLDTLRPEGLRNHLIEILKAEHRDLEMDRECRFLRFCLDHVHKYLACPYRESVLGEISVELVDRSLLRVTERLSYTCRQAAGCIQNHVAWQADSREVLAVEDLRIELRWPKGKPGAVQKEVWELDDISCETLQDGSCRFEHDLSPYGTVDGLRIAVESTYLAHLSTSRTWRFPELSRDAELVISCPPECELQLRVFGLDYERDLVRPDRGLFYHRRESWILPGSGISWKLIQPGLPRTVMIGSLEDYGTTLEDLVANAAD